MNCVANGKILNEKIFENIWVQPAAGDAGGSLGAALALWHIEQENERTVNINDDMQGSYLGNEFSQVEIEKELSGKPSTIKIKESECVMKSFDVIIDGESHTLGHLLQSHIQANHLIKMVFAN